MKGTTLRISKIHKRNENFNISGDVDTSGVSIDADLAKQYSERVVEYAKKLKAKNGTKYSDEYYLSMARNIDVREMKGAYSEVFHKKAALCPIQDPQWAGYSYEEIIQMENSGYKIPEDVLLWAHAQQESDVVAYQIISDETNLDDNSSTEEITGDNSINNIQKTAKEYVNKADNAQKDNLLKIEEFQKTVDKAQEVKEERENSYKNSIQEITKLSDELKQLETKNKNKTLSQSEESRYNELSKILNNSNNNTMKRLQTDSNELDELLSSMNMLNSEASENIQLSQNTLKAAEDLSKLGRNYNDNMATHSTKGIVYQNTGLLNDILYGVNTTSIQKVALDTGTALETNTNDIISKVNSGKNIELESFAKEYTRTVQNLLPKNNPSPQENNPDKTEETQTENTLTQSTKPEPTKDKQPLEQNIQQKASKNPPEQTAENNQEVNDSNNTIQNEDLNNQEIPTDEEKQQIADNNQKQNKDSNNQKTQETTQTNNNPLTALSVTGSPQGAIKAATISSITTSNLREREAGISKDTKSMQQEFNTAQKDITKLQKEQTKIQSKYQANQQETETYLAELDSIAAENNDSIQKIPQPQAEQKQSPQNTSDQNLPDNKNENKTGTITPALSDEIQNTQPDTNNEIEPIIGQINNISTENQKIASDLNKEIITSNTSTNKGQKSKINLQKQNQQFNVQNQNAKQISNNATITGAITTGFGTYNLSVGIPLLQNGIALMLNPFTYSIGQTMSIQATKQIIEGSAQVATGAAANIAGGIGIAASNEASDEIQNTNLALSEAQKTAAKNQKAIQAANIPELTSTEVQPADNQNTEANIPTTNLANKNENIQNIQTSTAQNRPETTADKNTPEQNKIQTTATSNTRNKETVSNKTNDAEQIINSQTNKVDDMLNEDTKISQILEDKIIALNSSTKTIDDKEDIYGDIKLLQRTLENSDSERVINTKNDANDNIPIQEENQQQSVNIENTSDNSALLAASATTAADIKSATVTDDKTTIKLERFNNDSIIESKKKMKKVTAVSAARGGKT